MVQLRTNHAWHQKYFEQIGIIETQIQAMLTDEYGNVFCLG
jgi:hypothetical protein